MSANTVKLDAALLREIAQVKSDDLTLAAYVRDALWRDVRRKQMRRSAEIYQTLLRDNAAERKLMDDWEAAPLAVEPRAKQS